ncbi:uncharacterized protein LOC122870248 isoform X1 [Siniperca chuatsi]|uniref:uncharacterized protein LOC122870248 isoform X1 n=1 Tax=Siniperca chuatsi TaxID=119488 RepID=UPI001CE0CD87|nr:uncharacterized protein LOC122870248 isoform X1 [Siniperca chuatsi]XP_044040251.1 uncharacterized protein LOC122870248 isoform X1 [Siniperca chuatsi]
MRYTFLSALTTVLALSTWKYHFQKDENTVHDKIIPLLQQESQEKEKEGGKVLTTLVEQKKELRELTDKPKLKKNCTDLNPKVRLFFKPAFTAFSLDSVLVLLIIHTFGADLVASISTVSGYMSSTGGLLDLAFSFILAGYAMYKWKREKAELVTENTQLQNESLKKEKERKDAVATLTEVKTELESQRGRLKELLKEVEREREVNKQRLQSVETDITEREITFDKPEELLKEKENLLKDQWKLDEKKKSCEGQLLNNERLLEPIESHVTRIHMKEGNMQI